MTDPQSMPLVFWQPCLSIHQTPLLEKVAEAWPSDVYLVVDREEPRGRAENAGWRVKAPDGVLVSTSGISIPSRAIHVISGMRGPTQWRKFRKDILRDHESKIWVAAESLETTDGIFKVIARFIRHGHARLGLGGKLEGFLGIGRTASRQAKILGVPPARIFSFCYVTKPAEKPHTESSLGARGHSANILFIGRVEKEKGADLLLSSNFRNNVQLRIIGNHTDKAIEIPSGVDYLGIVPNETVLSELASADALILPSRYDGWGAVVNEALTVGTPVICTTSCGAAHLLETKKPYRGEIITSLSSDAIVKAVNNVLDFKTDREMIKQWSQDSISPTAVSRYLVELLNGKKPSPPWEM